MARDPAANPASPASPTARRRSPVEIRWRQFRNAPRPVVRAVLSSLIVASVLAAAYLAYDVAISRGAALPGGDLRVLFVAVLIAAVLVTGSVVTYLVVPLPKGSGERGRRSTWSARARALRRRAHLLSRPRRRRPDPEAALHLRVLGLCIHAPLR